MGRLGNKVAIVTGAASGFGAETARLYVAEGAKVVIGDINEDGAKTVAASLGDAAFAIKCDVSKRGEVENLVQQALKRFGAIDIVVNNAGWTHRNMPLLEVDEESFDRVYAVNVKSIYYMTIAVVPIMRRQRRGVILNIGSTAGIRPRPGLTWYNSSKGAVNLLSKSMAVELGPDGIRVNAICPGVVDTPMWKQIDHEWTQIDQRAPGSAWQDRIRGVPMGRPETPEDLTGMAVFLASADSDYITGQSYNVDGGLVMS